MGISADAFEDAAVRITNDVRLGAWVLDNCNRSDEQISAFNRQLVSWWRKQTPHNYFSERRRELAREDTDFSFWDSLLIWITLDDWFKLILYKICAVIGHIIEKFQI